MLLPILFNNELFNGGERMKRNSLKWLLLIIIITAVTMFSIQALVAATKIGSSKTTLWKATYPDNMFDLRHHDVGQLYLPITNYGIHGHEVGTGGAGGIWPKGSGQAYIFGAGIWIGAIKGGKKLVSVGYNPNSGQSELVPGFELDLTGNYTFDNEAVRVLMSTDYPTRFLEENMPEWPFGYYHPDPDGNPETNDADTVHTWAEAGEEYKPVTVSVQDSYAWFSDADQTYKFDASADILGVHILQHGYAWNYFFNQDFAFLSYDIINTSDGPLQDMYLAVTVDPDIGDAADDMVGFDESRNLAFVYDNDGKEAGWSSPPGHVGYVFLESPVDPNTGEQLGLTAFRIFTIDVDPGTDVERYDVISANGTFDVDTSPADKRFSMPTGPFTLAVGETVRVVIGMICAKDLDALKVSCDLAQQMYDLGWVSPAPPDEPKITLIPGDGKVTIKWDSKSENSIDPVSGEQDFEGYRLYKSRTGIGPLGNWEVANPTIEWQLIAQWDFNDGFTNNNPINEQDLFNESHPEDKYLGEDSGLEHEYIDTDVINGIQYHYAITAYDRGNIAIRSLECGLILNQNRASVRPGFYKMGYEKAKVLDVTHAVDGGTTSEPPRVSIVETTMDEVIDAMYEISFQYIGRDKTFSVINLNDNSVVVENSTNLTGDTYFNGVTLTLSDTTAGNLISSAWVGEINTNWSCGNVTPIQNMPYDYEIRFTDEGSITLPFQLPLPFEVWRIEQDSSYKAKNLFFSDNPNDTEEMKNKLTNGDVVKVIEEYYDIVANKWKTGFTFTFDVIIPENDVAPVTGDVFKMVMTKPYTIKDKYTFRTEAEKINPKKEQLENIKVVPNPYLVRNTWERSGDYARMQFINLPEVCTIRIYTLAGDHVRTIEHNELGAGENNNPGWEWWDLLTHNEQKVVAGVYIYHIDASGIGEHIGKFAIIR